MKKIKKINLQIDKEVISSLSNDEMNTVKGGLDTILLTHGGTCTCANTIECETIAPCTFRCYGTGGGGGGDSDGCVPYDPSTDDCSIAICMEIETERLSVCIKCQV